MKRGIKYLTITAMVLILGKNDTTFAQDKFMYPVDEKKIAVQKDIVYKDLGSSKLHFDLYQPASGAGNSAPLVILMNGFGMPVVKNSPPMVGWANTIASDGMSAISFESHTEAIAEDFDDLYKYLKNHSEEFHFDTTKLVVMAFSGHVYYGLPIVSSPSRTNIRAAVIYYGASPVTEFRWDLPLLLVRAGRDNPANNRYVDTLLFKAMEHNSPWTIINHHSGGHPFETGTPDAQSMSVIRQTLDFMHRSVSDSLQQSIRNNADFILAATSAYTGNWPLAIEKYKLIIAKGPDNSDNYIKIGMVYLGNKQYRESLQAFKKALDMGDGRLRDMSVPASQAAARLHDRENTIFWLKQLIRSPNGKASVQNTTSSPEFDFIKPDAAYKELVK